MSHAAAYIRVSSRTQDYKSQRASIEKMAASRVDTISVWYSETKSAKTTVRAELQKLRDDARMGKLRTV